MRTPLEILATIAADQRDLRPAGLQSSLANCPPVEYEHRGEHLLEA